MTIRFDELELSPDAYERRADGQLVAVEPQVLDVLCYRERVPIAEADPGDTFAGACDWLDRVAEEAPA